MPKHETPMTRWFWERTRGTLIEEFYAVPRAPDCGPRCIDGVIIKGGEHRRAKMSEIDLTGKDIIVVQAKASRLGMNVMGQALFSKHLLERFNPRSIESVALVAKDDSVLRPIFEKYEGMRVVVCPPEAMFRAILPDPGPVTSDPVNSPGPVEGSDSASR